MNVKQLIVPAVLAGAILPAAAHAQTVSGNFTTATVASTISLTLEGTSDWAKYDYSGNNTSPVSFVDKLTGGGQISQPTLQFGFFSNPSETPVSGKFSNPTTFS